MADQTLWDLAAIASAIFAGVFTYGRRQMLSGQFTSWLTGTGLIQALLAVQGIWMGMVALNIAFSNAHASPRETVTLGISAVVSWGMQRNLERRGRLTPKPPNITETAI